MQAVRLLLFAALWLSPGIARSSEIRDDSIVGTWEAVGGTCEGDNSVTYKADGTFFAYDVRGRWALRGKKLITFTTERGEPDEEVYRVNPPERNEETIVSVNHDRITSRWSDGSLHNLHRCR